jgi:hypothetical protein
MVLEVTLIYTALRVRDEFVHESQKQLISLSQQNFRHASTPEKVHKFFSFNLSPSAIPHTFSPYLFTPNTHHGWNGSKPRYRPRGDASLQTH